MARLHSTCEKTHKEGPVLEGQKSSRVRPIALAAPSCSVGWVTPASATGVQARVGISEMLNGLGKVLLSDTHSSI